MIKIVDDLFDISWRLKAIDNEYELFYNKNETRYEVWAKGILQLVVPYKKLDSRTLDYVRKTRVENRENLINEIDCHNLKIETQRELLFNEEKQYKTKNLVKYLEKGKRYIPNYDEI